MIYMVRVMVFAELDLPEDEAEQEEAMNAYANVVKEAIEGGTVEHVKKIRVKRREDL